MTKSNTFPSKILLAFFLIAIITNSCIERPKKIFSFKGEWTLDSQSNIRTKPPRNFLYINNKSELYRFSYESSSYILDSCLHYKDATFRKGNSIIYSLNYLDSSKMILSDTNDSHFYYKRPSYFTVHNVEQEINDFIKCDSLKQRITGWWRLKKSTYKPIFKLTSHDTWNAFTMHLSSYGEANFYENDNLDSITTYQWKAGANEIEFESGCLAGIPGKIEMLNSNELIMTFNRAFDNKLLFERIEPKIK